VPPGASLSREVSPPVEASAVGLISHLTPGSDRYGTEVGAITVETADGKSVRLPVRAGIETGAGKPGANQAVPPVVARGLHDPEVQEYAARFGLPVGTRVARLTVQATGLESALAVRALTLVGTDGSSRVVDLSPAYRLAYLGDTKVYENTGVLPRAYVVGRVRVVPSDRAALEALRSAEFDPRAEAVVTAGDLRAAGIRPEQGSSEAVRIVGYSEEAVAIEVDLSAPGLLVLSDANYPGWRAVVDGLDRPIVTANYLFKGVWLDQGRHRVEFRFEPASLRWGLLIGGVAALLSLALVVFGPRLERSRDRAA